MDHGLGGSLGRERFGEEGDSLAYLWESLLHRMIPKEQKEPVMAVMGDLAGPGKMGAVLSFPQTPLLVPDCGHSGRLAPG